MPAKCSRCPRHLPDAIIYDASSMMLLDDYLNNDLFGALRLCHTIRESNVIECSKELGGVCVGAPCNWNTHVIVYDVHMY